MMAIRFKNISYWFSYGITIIGALAVVISLVWFTLYPVSFFSFNGLALTFIFLISAYIIYHAKRFTDELKKVKK